MTDPLARDDSAPATQAGVTGATELGGLHVVPYYQPFYNLRDGRLQGVEALARRRGAGTGAGLPPGFLADAGATGLIRAIDLCVLDKAVQDVAEWRSSGERPDLICSVNLSWDFVGHALFVSEVSSVLLRHRMPGDRLLVDVPTNSFRLLKDTDRTALGHLRELQQLEVAFCLDGFTAEDLDLLAEPLAVPVDIIKLQPGEISGADQAGERLAGLASAIQDRGLPVVATGVETPGQLGLVRELGFEWAQGFLLGVPASAADIRAYPSQLNLR